MKFFVLFCSCIWLISGIPLEQETPRIKREIGGRIIGGLHATRSQFPFLVAIQTTTSTATFFCGGSLLNQQWVLTAGHCVDAAVSFNIRLGAASLNNDDPYMVTVATENYVLHPDYNPNTLENDIGLIEFRMPITYNEYIKPIDYLPGAPLADNAILQTMGWGQISDASSELSSNIRFITLTTLSNLECMSYYGNQILDTMVCAATNYNGGTCYGDTGGPLIQHISRGMVMHVAVSSFISQNGCESPYPSGFTRTYPYVAWIRNITGF